MNSFKADSMNRAILRNNAYRYIKDRLCKLAITDAPDDITISLEDLRQLKEGVADPSKALVVSLKRILGDKANTAEIDNYLVKPFE